MDKREVLKGLENVMHPAINFSLIDLGIIKDINIEDENAKVIFAVPFKNNPIVH
ncbi:MAG: iron-sulfur cluster assembly protein, partial [Chlorobi bacterium]|nr:iron-sulfur cluster assembly protein [Chlorobiota bacterium]